MILNVRVKKRKFALEEKREQRVILNLISHLDQKINLKIKPSIVIKKLSIYLQVKSHHFARQG